LFLLAVSAALLIPLPAFEPSAGKSALYEELENLCHPLAFAALALVFARTSMTIRRGAHSIDLVWICALLVVFGAITELLQATSGRDASMVDFIGDVLGCVIGSGLHWDRHSNCASVSNRLLTRSVWVSATLLTALPLSATAAAYASRWAHFPVFWQLDAPLTHRFSRHQEGNYPGLDIREPPADWREFRELLITVRNLGNTPARFALRVNDRNHTNRYEDRFNREFEIAGGATRSYAILVEDILKSPSARQMDVSQIETVLIFQLREHGDPLVEVVRVALAR